MEPSSLFSWAPTYLPQFIIFQKLKKKDSISATHIYTFLLPLSLCIILGGMAIHPSTLAWKIPWTEEPDRLQSVGYKESDTTERLYFHLPEVICFIDQPTKHSVSVQMLPLILCIILSSPIYFCVHPLCQYLNAILPLPLPTSF